MDAADRRGIVAQEWPVEQEGKPDKHGNFRGRPQQRRTYAAIEVAFPYQDAGNGEQKEGGIVPRVEPAKAAADQAKQGDEQPFSDALNCSGSLVSSTKRNRE